MDILKRELAPITDRAWEEITKEATRTLRTSLSARKVVDVEGPKGLDFAAVNLGRLEMPSQEVEGVGYGIHKSLPLIELRVNFEMDLWELDNAERGAKDINVDAVADAAQKIAAFEERAIYKGFAPAKIVGMEEASGGTQIALGQDASKYPEAIIRAKIEMKNREVEGPYALILGPNPYRILYGSYTGYPAQQQVEELIGAEVIYSPFIDGGFFVSKRGGDLELTIGQDFAVGYEAHLNRKVRLYLTESFTFRVLESDAVVGLSYEMKPVVERRPTVVTARVG